MPRYVALLRGINVGGSNLIRMRDLRACFERHGFDDVSTYIQSGNVLFGVAERSTSSLTSRIETMLGDAFDYEASVILRSPGQLARTVGEAPMGFGEDLGAYRCDVMFLRPSLVPGDVVAQLPVREGVDRAWPGPGVVYFERLTSRATQSRLGKLVSKPIYRQMTIRNWRTTTRLNQLLGGG